MMRLGICYNPSKPEAVRLAVQMCEFLRKRGVEVLYIGDAPQGEDAILPADAEKREIEMLITSGGDGTVLRAMRWFPGPVLAVNAGGLGFLTEIAADATEESLKRLLTGDYLMDARMKIMTMRGGERLPDAVNEVILHTDQVGKIRDFHVSIRNEKIGKVRADGIMVATPTGSTSYALSSGGSILHPSMDAMVVVYMSPFSLTAKPMVVPGDSLIEITSEGKGCLLVIDGQEGIDVHPGETVHISRSETRARFVRFKPHFFVKLSKRLMQE